jgi:hypothetical protein
MVWSKRLVAPLLMADPVIGRLRLGCVSPATKEARWVVKPQIEPLEETDVMYGGWIDGLEVGEGTNKRLPFRLLDSSIASDLLDDALPSSSKSAGFRLPREAKAETGASVQNRILVHLCTDGITILRILAKRGTWHLVQPGSNESLPFLIYTILAP